MAFWKTGFFRTGFWKFGFFVDDATSDTHDGASRPDYAHKWRRKERKRADRLLDEVRDAYERIIEGKVDVPQAAKEKLEQQVAPQGEQIDWIGIAADRAELARIAASVNAVIALSSEAEKLILSLNAEIMRQKERIEKEEEEVAEILLLYMAV